MMFGESIVSLRKNKKHTGPLSNVLSVKFNREVRALQVS